MSSIIAHSYAVQEKYLQKPIAGMLLSAILSDTLNLKSPTTTAWDERIVAMLVQYLEEKDVNELAARQFRAKSQSLSLMTPYALVNGDMKQFKFSSLNEAHEVAYSVIKRRKSRRLAGASGVYHTGDASRKIGKSGNQGNLIGRRRYRQFELYAHLVRPSRTISGHGGVWRSPEAEETLLQLPGLVSRKKDFIPP